MGTVETLSGATCHSMFYSLLAATSQFSTFNLLYCGTTAGQQDQSYQICLFE